MGSNDADGHGSWLNSLAEFIHHSLHFQAHFLPNSTLHEKQISSLYKWSNIIIDADTGMEYSASSREVQSRYVLCWIHTKSGKIFNFLHYLNKGNFKKNHFKAAVWKFIWICCTWTKGSCVITSHTVRITIVILPYCPDTPLFGHYMLIPMHWYT